MIALTYYCEDIGAIQSYRFDDEEQAIAFAIVKGWKENIFKEKDKKEWIVFNQKPNDSCNYHRITK